MSKRDQTIRVILERAGDKRALLVVWRKGWDFYSAIVGSSSHRTHHERGRVHTNVGRWGSKEYYVEKGNKEPAGQVNGTQILQGLIIRNGESLHFGEVPLKKYTGKNADLVITIEEKEVEGDSIILIVSGFTSDPRHTKSKWADLVAYRSLEIVKLEVLNSKDSHSIFVAILQARSCFENKIIGQELKHLMKVDFLVIPEDSCISQSVEGESTYATIRLPNLGPAPQPANPEPPELPTKQEEWMPVYEVKLSFQPLIGAKVRVGPLTIQALPSSVVVSQPMRISLTADGCRDEETGFTALSNRIPFVDVVLQYAQYKGHAEKQFELSGQKFQISMKYVGDRKLGPDGAIVKIGSEKGEWWRTYHIEIVELSAKC